MKKILSLAMLLVASGEAFAQKEVPDTLFNASAVEKVMIIDGADGLTVQTVVSDADSTATFDFHQKYSDNVRVKNSKYERNKYPLIEDLELPMYHPKGRKWTTALRLGGSLDFGFSAPQKVAPGLKFDMASSLDFSWHNLIYLETRQASRKNAFSVGLGFSWRTFRMGNGQRFILDNGAVKVVPFPDEADYKFSRALVFSLSVPVLWKHRFSKNHALMFGPIVNFNTYGSLLSQYNDGVREVKISENLTNCVPVTVDLYGSFSITRNIGLFVRYSPCNVLRTASAPQFTPFSVGVQIGF